MTVCKCVSVTEGVKCGYMSVKVYEYDGVTVCV